MGIVVRAAQTSDKEACIELLQELIAATGESLSADAGDAFDGLLDGVRGRVLVAEEDGQFLGLASLTYNLAMRYGGEYCQLEELVVDPSARGRHVGALLVEASLAQARERGCREIGAYLTESNEHNRTFYAKFGFKAVGPEMRQAL